MMRLKNTPILILILVLATGCQVFPYLYGPATPTPVETADPTSTQLPLPTATLEPPEPSPTQVGEEPEETLTPTPEESTTPQVPTNPYVFQDGSPAALPNFANPDAACDWMGTAGQVFDSEGNVIPGLTIHIGSSEEIEFVQSYSVTGQATAYGAGGYEVQISSTPKTTQNTFWIQVLDPDGKPLSDRIFFDTYDDCEKNLILINFVPLDPPEDQAIELTPAATATPEAYP